MEAAGGAWVCGRNGALMKLVSSHRRDIVSERMMLSKRIHQLSKHALKAMMIREGSKGS